MNEATLLALLLLFGANEKQECCVRCCCGEDCWKMYQQRLHQLPSKEATKPAHVGNTPTYISYLTLVIVVTVQTKLKVVPESVSRWRRAARSNESVSDYKNTNISEGDWYYLI